MEPSLFTTLSRTVITTVIAIGSLFYSTISGVNAKFEPLELRTKGNQLVLSAALENWSFDDLDQILLSGQEIKILFRIQVLELENSTPVVDSAFFHSLQYSLLDGVFDVYRSEEQGNLGGLSLSRAKTALARIEDYPAVALHQLDPQKNYYIQVSAGLDRIHLPGQDEDLNLMFYWNSIKPSRNSDTFNVHLFQQ